MSKRLGPLKWSSLHVVISNKLLHLFLRSAAVPEGRTPGQHSGLLPRNLFHLGTPEEAVVLHTFLPEVFAFISSIKKELDSILVIPIALRVKLGEEPLSFEGEFSNLGPGEGVDFSVVLKY